MSAFFIIDRSREVPPTFVPGSLMAYPVIDKCILETFRSFCRTAPLTTDVKVLGYHYQLVNAYVRFLLNERKFGPKTDEAGQKKRETAYVSLERVVQNGAKQFSSFTASSQDQYKKIISGMINTILPVWIQYRNTYINF